MHLGGYMSSRTILLAGCLSFLLNIGVTFASPAPILDVKRLCERADLIVVGRILTKNDVGHSEMPMRDHLENVRLMESRIRVDNTLKGDAESEELMFRFVLPTSESYGYHGVPSEGYRILFLKRNGSTWEVSDPFYPSLPAVPNTPVLPGDTYTRVVATLAASLDLRPPSKEEERELIRVLGTIQTPASTDALVRASQQPDKLIQASAISELLRRDETRVMPVALELLSNSQGIPDYLVQNLASSISIGVRRPDVIPSLGRLLKSSDVRVRRAAASALRNTQSPSAAPRLASALGDDDFKVRFYAVAGLAEITRQNEWQPSQEEFRENEQKYVAHWSEWASARNSHDQTKQP